MDDMTSAAADFLDVVVATDGSADADLAVDWAAEEAMRRSASLLILTAQSPAEAWSEPPRAALDIVDLAADRVRRHFPGLTVATKVVQGDPRQALQEYQERAALVVLGSRGLNALRTIWLGSVSYWATRHLQVPTVIVRPLAGGHHRTAMGIAVGVDAGDSADPLRAAFEMAAHRRCGVTIAHAWWDVEGPDARSSVVAPSEVEPARHRLVDALVGPVAADYPEVPFKVVFGHGSVVAFLLDIARSHEALIVGRKRPAPFDSVGLGTVASAIVEHARGVTVVVPESTDVEGRE